MIRRTAVTLSAAVVISTALVTGATAGDTAPAPTVTPCASEDSPGPCYWDAHTRGNRVGESFFVDDEGRVYYARPTVRAWKKAMRREGFRRWKGTYAGHRHCMAFYGDTTAVVCWDGYATTT